MPTHSSIQVKFCHSLGGLLNSPFLQSNLASLDLTIEPELSPQVRPLLVATIWEGA